MYVKKFTPKINEVYFIKKNTLIHVLSGKGSIQVDFNNYFDWQEKAIFLEKGQYIKFLSEDFVVRKIEFNHDTEFYNSDIRVLFKHLISLGYIDLMECSECQQFLANSISTNSTSEIIDISSKQWYWQNPFNANKEEYKIIFDVKDIIDKEYANQLSNADLVDIVKSRGHNAQTLVKNKVGLSVKKLLHHKRIQESSKQVAFTDKNIQEVSYNLGFKDDAYFNRVFKKSTGQTPKNFRENFDYKNRDLFTQDVLTLLKEHHMEEKSIGFYAQKMNLSIKTLSTKVQAKMNTSIGQLIRLEITNTAKKMLSEGTSVNTTSHYLGFQEPNHFTRFFKNYTGITPTQFTNKKYNL